MLKTLVHIGENTGGSPGGISFGGPLSPVFYMRGKSLIASAEWSIPGPNQTQTWMARR
jgi:hypothetical protein